MAAANRQGQGEARPPADAAPALPDRALYARLRKCELAAYSHVLRAFVGQGLVLDASRRRMLDDLRAMLFVSERRHHGELAAAQADRALHAIAAKGVSGHRAQFAAQAPLPAAAEAEEDGEEEEDGASLPAGGSDTEDSAPPAPRAAQQRAGRKPKRRRAAGGPGEAEVPRPNSVSSNAVVGPTVVGGPNPFLTLSLPELEGKVRHLEGEVADLERSLSVTVDAARQAALKATLLGRLQELDRCIEALAAEPNEGVGGAIPEKAEATPDPPEASLAGMSRRIAALQQKINELQLQLNESQDDAHKAKIKKELEVRLEELTAMINELVDEEEEEEEAAAPGVATEAAAAAPDDSAGPAAAAPPAVAPPDPAPDPAESPAGGVAEAPAGGVLEAPASSEEAEEEEMLEAMVGIVAAASNPTETTPTAGDHVMSEDELEGDLLGDRPPEKDEAGGQPTTAEMALEEEEDEPE